MLVAADREEMPAPGRHLADDAQKKREHDEEQKRIGQLEVRRDADRSPLPSDLKAGPPGPKL